MIRCEKEFLESSSTFHGAIPRVMGTRLEMLISGSSEEDASRLWDWLCVEAFHLDSILDRFNPVSELSALNSCDGWMEVSETLASVLGAAARFHSLTDGLFDVAGGGMGEVETDGHRMVRLNGHRLDFGGMAKGYLLKSFGDRLAWSGVKSAFVDFGSSSILTVGTHPFGDCWKVGIRDPFGVGTFAEVELRGNAMSTSGNTPSYGSHIMDPRTGKPVEGRRQVVVIADDALAAEVLSTTLMIAGEEQGKDILTRFPGVEVRMFGE